MPLPPDADNLRYLLRADAGTYQNAAGTTPATADGDPVQLWADQGANHNGLVYNSAAVLKTNQINTTMPCLRFDGSSNYYYHLDQFVSPLRTLYAVVKIPGSGVYTLVNGVSGALQWRLDTNKQRLVKNLLADIGFGTTTISNNTWTQINVSWDGQNGVFRTAAAADATVSFGSNVYGISRFAVGVGGVSLNTEFYATDLALLMEYAAVHDLTTKQSVEGWITSTWGV